MAPADSPLTSRAFSSFAVDAHSALYETAPAYVTDQPSFLNAAALVRVRDASHPMANDPVLLLDRLKRVEKELGREEGGVRFGPRPIDLDIIFHRNGTHGCERLEVPHPRYHERPFVLAPLADLAANHSSSNHRPSFASSSPSPEKNTGLHRGDDDAGTRGGYGGGLRTWADPIGAGLATAARLWAGSGGEVNVNAAAGSGATPIRRVMPIGGGVNGRPSGRLWSWGDRTNVMAILNVTPDSFSDGGALMMDRYDDRHDPAVNVAAALAAARRAIESGADFLDVGGQSTRPGASRVSANEEAARVVPVVEALAAMLVAEYPDREVYLSVDTFYGDVAESAASAGADVINDVSGGTIDRTMHARVANLPRPLPYVAMHSRGDPTTMQLPENTRYATGDVCAEIARESVINANRAVRAGIEPWRLWTDPGLGFAKTKEGNWDVLRGLGRIRERMGGALARAPQLVGASRKGFLGDVLGDSGRRRDESPVRSPRDRDVASAAAAVAAVAGGADVVRVHDVRATVDAVRVADAVWRSRRGDAD